MAVPIKRFNEVQGVLLLSTRPGEIDKILREERIVIWLAGLGRAARHPRHVAAAWRAPSPGPCAGCRRPPSR